MGFPERVGVVGSGTIACGVAACVAAAGGSVAVWARSEESAERARGLIDRARCRARRSTTDLEVLSEATMLVEAVAEQPGAKRDVYRALRDVRGDDALLATTTSSLSIASLAEQSGDPSRFFGLHVFNPVPKMELVELCFPDAATDHLRARAAAFCEAIGKTAVEVPDEPGFVVNRLLFPYLFDAVRLLERTGMEPGQIDDCMKLGAAIRWGRSRCSTSSGSTSPTRSARRCTATPAIRAPPARDASSCWSAKGASGASPAPASTGTEP